MDRIYTVYNCAFVGVAKVLIYHNERNEQCFYFPNGRYIDYLSLTYATDKNKILKLHYTRKYYKYYKQHSRYIRKS